MAWMPSIVPSAKPFTVSMVKAYVIPLTFESWLSKKLQYERGLTVSGMRYAFTILTVNDLEWMEEIQAIENDYEIRYELRDIS